MAAVPDINQLLSAVRILESQKDHAANRIDADRRTEMQVQERLQAAQMQEEERRAQLQEQEWQHAWTIYQHQKDAYQKMEESWNKGDVAEYNQQLNRLKALETAAKAQNIKANSKAENWEANLTAVDGFMKAEGKNLKPDQLNAGLAPYVAKESIYSQALTKDPMVLPYIQDYLRAPTPEARAQLHQDYVAKFQGHINPNMAKYEQQMADLKPIHSHEAERKQIDEFMAANPAEVVRQFLPGGAFAGHAAAQQDAATAQLQDLVRQGIDHNVGRHVPDALLPYAAGTIKGAHGTYVVPTAGSGAGISKAFDEYNRNPGAYDVASYSEAQPVVRSAGGTGQLHGRSDSTVAPYATPEEATHFQKLFPKDSGQRTLRMQDVPGYPPTPSLPQIGQLGMLPTEHLQHMAKADSLWNGPRSDELREKLKGMPPERIRDGVAMASIRHGVPEEHLYAAGVRGGFIPEVESGT